MSEHLPPGPVVEDALVNLYFCCCHHWCTIKKPTRNGMTVCVDVKLLACAMLTFNLLAEWLLLKYWLCKCGSCYWTSNIMCYSSNCHTHGVLLCATDWWILLWRSIIFSHSQDVSMFLCQWKKVIGLSLKTSQCYITKYITKVSHVNRW